MRHDIYVFRSRSAGAPLTRCVSVISRQYPASECITNKLGTSWYAAAVSIEVAILTLPILAVTSKAQILLSPHILDECFAEAAADAVSMYRYLPPVDKTEDAGDFPIGSGTLPVGQTNVTGCQQIKRWS